jgi:hypothetical protein
MATEKDNVNTGLLGAIAAVLTLAVLGIALAVTALVRSSEDEQVAIKSEEARKPFDEMKQQQSADLAGNLSWADKNKGTVRVPIDRAMQLVVKGVQEDPNSATAPAPPPKAAPDADGGTEGGAGGSADASDGGAEAAAAATDAGAGAPSEAGTTAADAAAPKPAP